MSKKSRAGAGFGLRQQVPGQDYRRPRLGTARAILGVKNRTAIPWAEIEAVAITTPEADKLLRLMRRYAGMKTGAGRV